jgi:hypothetical protein
MTKCNCSRLRQFAVSLFITFLLSLQVHAQQINPDGYYITLTNDTISGSFIHYRETVHNPSSITFLRKGSLREIVLIPDSCLAISVSQSDTYLSYHGKRLVNPTSSVEVEGNQLDQYEDVSVFLRELYNNGHYRLYGLTDRRRANFFVSGDTIRLQELYFKAYNEGGHAVESSRYKQQLSFFFSNLLNENAALLHRLERIQYNESDLVKYFQVATGTRSNHVHEKYPARVFVGLGLSANFFNLSGSDPGIVTGHYPTTFSPVIQAGVHVPFGRGGEKLFMTFLLQAYAWKNFASTPYVGSDTFKATVISLPASIGYKLIKGPKASLALSGGLEANLLLDNAQDGKYQGASDPFHVDNNGTFSFTGFAGTELFLGHRVSFALNYYLPYAVGPFAYYKPNHSSAQFSLRYAP